MRRSPRAGASRRKRPGVAVVSTECWGEWRQREGHCPSMTAERPTKPAPAGADDFRLTTWLGSPADRPVRGTGRPDRARRDASPQSGRATHGLRRVRPRVGSGAEHARPPGPGADPRADGRGNSAPLRLVERRFRGLARAISVGSDDAPVPMESPLRACPTGDGPGSRHPLSGGAPPSRLALLRGRAFGSVVFPWPTKPSCRPSA